MKIRPLDDRVLFEKYEKDLSGSILQIPEKYRASYGTHQSGRAYVLGIIRAKGPKVSDEVRLGDCAIINPLNIETVPVDGEDLHFTREGAIVVLLRDS